MSDVSAVSNCTRCRRTGERCAENRFIGRVSFSLTGSTRRSLSPIFLRGNRPRGVSRVRSSDSGHVGGPRFKSTLLCRCPGLAFPGARVTLGYLRLSTRNDLSLVAGSALDGGNRMGWSHLAQPQEGTARRQEELVEGAEQQVTRPPGQKP